MKRIAINFLKKIRQYLTNQQATENLLLNQGKILEELYSVKDARALSDYEWKVFSQ